MKPSWFFKKKKKERKEKQQQQKCAKTETNNTDQIKKDQYATNRATSSWTESQIIEKALFTFFIYFVKTH